MAGLHTCACLHSVDVAAKGGAHLLAAARERLDAGPACTCCVGTLQRTGGPVRRPAAHSVPGNSRRAAQQLCLSR